MTARQSQTEFISELLNSLNAETPATSQSIVSCLVPAAKRASVRGFDAEAAGYTQLQNNGLLNPAFPVTGTATDQSQLVPRYFRPDYVIETPQILPHNEIALLNSRIENVVMKTNKQIYPNMGIMDSITVPTSYVQSARQVSDANQARITSRTYELDATQAFKAKLVLNKEVIRETKYVNPQFVSQTLNDFARAQREDLEGLMFNGDTAYTALAFKSRGANARFQRNALAGGLEYMKSKNGLFKRATLVYDIIADTPATVAEILTPTHIVEATNLIDMRLISAYGGLTLFINPRDYANMADKFALDTVRKTIDVQDILKAAQITQVIQAQYVEPGQALITAQENIVLGMYGDLEFSHDIDNSRNQVVLYADMNYDFTVKDPNAMVKITSIKPAF
jgi:hypothetical protein